MRPRLASGIVVAAILLASPARAELPVRPVHLVYVRAPGAERCQDEAALRRAVRERLGYEAFDDAAQATLTTTIVRQRGRLVARIDLFGPGESGAQEISGGTECAGLESAVVVAVALAIDPLALERSETAAPPSAAGAPPSVERPARPQDGRRPERPRPPPPKSIAPPPVRRLAVRTSAGMAIAAGSTPGPALGTIVGVEAAWRRVAAGLEWQSYLPTSEVSSTGARARASLSKGAMLGCAAFGRVAACGLFSAGVLRGVGSGVVDRARSESSAYASVGARIDARLPLARGFSVRLHGDIEVPLIETRLVVGRSTLFETSTVVAGAGLGLSVDLL